MTLSDQVVLITGCSQGGIGDALAREFRRRGLRVIATASTLSKIQHLESEGIEILSLDVVEKASIQNAVEAISKLTKGRLDILVNNAGVGYQMPLLDTDLDDARNMFEVNLWGLLAMTQAFAPLLVATAAKGHTARVLNIGSVASRVQVPWAGAYNASKAALHSLNDTLRIELAPFGVGVLHVVTGGIQTNFYPNVGKVELPEQSIYYPYKGALESDITGDTAKSMQGLSVEKYASAVVSNTLSSRPRTTYWIGTKSLLSWLADRVLPDWINDWIIGGLMWPMGDLKEKVKKQRSQPQS
jgi:1-acylglycerone phosphate reductase